MVLAGVGKRDHLVEVYRTASKNVEGDKGEVRRGK